MSPRESLEGREWSVLADVAMSLVALTLIQLEIWVLGPESVLSTGESVVASVIGTVGALAILGRTIAPLTAFAVNAAALYLLIGVGYESDFYQWTNLVLIYAVAEHRRGPVSWVALGAALLAIAYYFTALPINQPLTLAVVIGLTWTLVWLAGRMAATRRREHTLQADRDLAAALAATDRERAELQSQRADMARELHDLIGHTVNVMVVHAGAARRAVRVDPDGAERALSTIESTGREALDELDRVLGVLRADTDQHSSQRAPTTPAPDLASLRGLAEQFDAAGLTTSIEVSGSTDRVPSTMALSIYRIVQESLTNTLKHAGATIATARISIDERWVTVRVEDDGRATDPGRVAAAGRGLRGISERAEMHGGTAEYGPRATGGFLVSCAIPLPAGA